MTGLVDQLQEDALDPSVPVSTLLRKVKVAAVKLGLNDALAWVGQELGGYTSDPPSYRQASGKPHGWNPYQGWLPILLGDDDLAEMLSSVPLIEPIANYERLIGNDDGIIYISLSNAIVQQLNGIFNWDLPKASVHISRGVVSKVVEHVRNMVLDWALELDRNGVKGEGLSFTASERQKVSNAHIHIGEFHGSFNNGDAIGANANINQSSNNVTVDQSVFNQIEDAVRKNVADIGRQEAIVQAAHAMRDAPSVKARLSAYQRLVTAAADHITVLTPFLPVLATMLAS